jgi:hypothetical protein
VRRDADDDAIVALAKARGSQMIVASDDGSLVLHPRADIPIVRVRDF